MINDQVVGHTVCMRGAIALTAAGLCRYCVKVSSSGQTLNRSKSVAQQRCIYGTANPTPTTWASTTATAQPTTTTWPTIATTTTGYYWFPPTTVWVPPTTATTTLPNTTLARATTTTELARATTTTAAVTAATTTTTTPVASAATTTTPATPQEEQPVEVVFPQGRVKWSPAQAIVKLPLFVWLEVPESPATQVITNAKGRSFSVQRKLDKTIWRFEVVNGQGDRWVDSKTCRGAGKPWRSGWIDPQSGEVTATALRQGACFYIYDHMVTARRATSAWRLCGWCASVRSPPRCPRALA